MAVEAVVALMVEKLDKLLSKEGQLLGVRGEIKHIRQELNQIRPFLKDADFKQKEDEDVRDWMEDIRDICFDVDDVIDILGQGQAAQGRHGFVERLKGRISDQITRYKVGNEIERIRLNIKGISRSRESYRTTETTSTQRLQEVSRCSVPPSPEKIETVITRVDDQLTNEEPTRDIDEGRQKASPSSRNLQAHRRVSTLPGEPEEVGLQEEINTVGQQLIEEEPRLWVGTRDISEGKLEASSSTPGRLEASSSAPSIQEDRRFSTLRESEEVGLQEEIGTVSEQLIKEESSHCDDTSDIDEGPECRDGSKNRKMQPKWSEQVLASSKPSLEGPPDDGCSWRKYAQEETLGAKHPGWKEKAKVWQSALIDLGTTYSCVGVWHSQHVQAEIIANDQDYRMTPSYVAFADKERLIGDAAKNQASMNPSNTVFVLWPFKVIAGEDNKPMIIVQYKGMEKQFSAEEISSMILTKICEIAQDYLGCNIKNVVAQDYLGCNIKNVVVTVPAYFNNS
ncbi:heat shock cognate protein 2-like protein [Cinnamomum micranthum f. kanehirae]|uniref:Heat shock cognate protein 2-like protein n=1 Tax=Cinnamomum micranthum f. kanehirae TaxID=337451 RepID=A0A3S3NWW9_9MAGN|nr:heat shock cognate protein 2-like protein [Cinnamomum micranthum f. kanehirae]